MFLLLNLQLNKERKCYPCVETVKNLLVKIKRTGYPNNTGELYRIFCENIGL
jgi:hypothetical protein